MLLFTSQVTQWSSDSAQDKHLVTQVTTLADPTGISSILAALMVGGINGHSGGGFLSGPQVIQLVASPEQVLQTSSHYGHIAYPSIWKNPSGQGQAGALCLFPAQVSQGTFPSFS